MFKLKTGRASFKYLKYQRDLSGPEFLFRSFSETRKSIVTGKYLQLFYDTVLKKLIELIKREEAKAILSVFKNGCGILQATF